MAKTQKTNPQKTSPQKAAQPAPNNDKLMAKEQKKPFTWGSLIPKGPFSIYDFNVQALIVALLAFVLYINTWKNEYAHDDGIVIVKNEYVQEGFDGLSSIFGKDAYDSYYKQLNTVNQLAGGRYRPLSIATFAIEQQFFGTIAVDQADSIMKQRLAFGLPAANEKKLIFDMHIRHLFNVFWYMACVVVVLYFLRKIVLKDSPLVALAATIIFTVHPMHTEVVANVKSRDEIMSLMFMCLTFILAFKYDDNRKMSTLLGACLCFFLAFLSKEYAITMAALLPLAFILFKNQTIPDALRKTLPYYAVIFIYVLLRIKIAIAGDPNSDGHFNIVSIQELLSKKGSHADKEVLNNPYVFASASQKVATEIATSLNYIKLLIFPHPLSADYSYNTIPYKNSSDPIVWLSILVHLAMLVGIAVFGFVKKQYRVLSFCIAFYLFHLLLVNNLIFNIGATMGERLIFHSSLGFAVIVAWLLGKAVEGKPAKVALQTIGAVVLVITLLCGYKTIDRNGYWKNDATLFLEDQKVAPNSVLVLGNVAAAYIAKADKTTDSLQKRELLIKGIQSLRHATAIHPTFVAGFMNMGVAYAKLNEPDSAVWCMGEVKKNYPNYPTLSVLSTLVADIYNKSGWNKYGQYGRYMEAVVEFSKGLKVDSTNSELWYNIGGAYFSDHKYADAISAWGNALKYNPKHEQARQGMNAAYAQLGIDMKTGQPLANRPPPPPSPPGLKQAQAPAQQATAQPVKKK